MEASDAVAVPGDESALLAPDEVAWLLDDLASASGALRSAALGALVTLPLSVDAWLAVSDRLAPYLHPEGSPDTGVLELAVQVPTRRVRNLLHEHIAALAEMKDDRSLVYALAQGRDTVVIPILHKDLQDQDDYVRRLAAEHLSFFAVREARDEFARLVANDWDVDTRFWAAVCLAKLDEPTSLEKFLTSHTPHDPWAFPAEGSDESVERLTFNMGDPSRTIEQVQGRGPWPAATQAMLERMAALEHDGREDFIIEGLLSGFTAARVKNNDHEDEVTSAHDAMPLEQAEQVRDSLERTFLNEAGMVWSPPEGLVVSSAPWESLATLPPQEATDLVSTLWQRVADIYQQQRTGEDVQADQVSLVGGGNEIVSLVHHMGSRFVPDVETLCHSFARLHDAHHLADQLGWTIGRADMHRVVTAVGEFSATGDQDAMTATSLIQIAGGHAGTDWPPLYGGSPASPATQPITYFVDEMTGIAPPGDETLTQDDHGSASEDEVVTDPPRTAYGLLDCPQVVLAEEEFLLELGLAAALAAGSSGDQLNRPLWSQGPYVLTARVHASGFSLRTGESLRNMLAVTVEDPYPSVALHLTPEPQEIDLLEREIGVTYYIGSQILGATTRRVNVVRTPKIQKVTLPPAQPLASLTRIPTDYAEPDLTVEIRKGREQGDLEWTFETPRASAVEVPDAPETSYIGGDGQQFALQLIQRMNKASQAQQKAGLPLRVRNLGIEIRESMPQKFWSILREVWAGLKDRTPTMLLLSQDPFIPWELALFEHPANPGREATLGAEIAIGRWVLPRGDHDAEDLPKDDARAIAKMHIMSGVYPEDKGRWRRLQHAEQEAADLMARYVGVPVTAEFTPVAEFLKNPPDTQAFHFAGHGIYDPASLENGLVLNDGSYLDAAMIGGARLYPLPRPFVFLNACQAGSSYTTLGVYSGLAAAFIRAGAAAVVAPIWSVNDGEARNLSLEFYEQAVEHQVPPAEILRRWRARFDSNVDGNENEPGSPVHLAYQFFGHPAMRLVREHPVERTGKRATVEPVRGTG